MCVRFNVPLDTTGHFGDEAALQKTIISSCKMSLHVLYPNFEGHAIQKLDPKKACFVRMPSNILRTKLHLLQMMKTVQILSFGCVVPLWRFVCIAWQLEMDRSSANAELQPKNSAERSARFGSATCELFGRTSAELQQKFGVNFAVLRLRRFALI